MSWRSSWSVECRFRPLPVCSVVVPNVCCLTLFLKETGLQNELRMLKEERTKQEKEINQLKETIKLKNEGQGVKEIKKERKEQLYRKQG